ncbi:anti-sigma factor [Actinotalea ferrariae CF5-4]|uniref:Anti-sigma factor n=1 Tax=Actinotalea ferrariae CF5-4 TaxID=948458 RepID=A0A021VPJ4_9CELL|nr:anti-sigma factor [Actinotalea ferrariae CF5-4]
MSRAWPSAAAAGLGAGPVQAPPDGSASGPLGPQAVVTDVSLTGEDAHREVLSWMADHGWASPVALPATTRVTGLRLDTSGTGTLELDLIGPDGPVVVVQEHGRLHPEVLRDLPVVDVGGRQVHLVCGDPWYVVWQSGDSVVTVVADGPTPDVRELVAAHPAAAYDDGVGARLSRGWDALTGSLLP